MFDELAHWRNLTDLIGKREAYRQAHGAEFLASPLWVSRSDGPNRVRDYATFVQIENLCAEVSKGVKGA